LGKEKGSRRSLWQEAQSAWGLPALDALAVFAGTGVDFDLVALGHENGHTDFKAGGDLGGLQTLPEVSPLTAGSVQVISRTTLVGSSTEMALPS
jgi:hypothetical protein